MVSLPIAFVVLAALCAAGAGWIADDARDFVKLFFSLLAYAALFASAVGMLVASYLSMDATVP